MLTVTFKGLWAHRRRLVGMLAAVVLGVGFLRQAVQSFDQTIVMVTHDPAAAAAADGVLFLSDGRIVGELREPTAEAVLDQLKAIGE